MKTVLITGIGGDIAQSVATIIRESKPHWRLVGVDIHSQHGGALFVDSLSLIPPAKAPEYLKELRALIVKESVDVFIPMTEPELAVLAASADLPSGLKRIWTGRKVVEECIDKLRTNKMLEKLGLPVPWTTPVGETSPLEYPCILKNRLGSGSRAVFTVKDREEADYLLLRYPEAVFQELLLPAEQEVTCAVYRTQDGRVATLQMLRKLVGGFTGWAKVINDEATAAMCKTIADGLDLRGSMNVQLRLTDKGPRVFEINPRFSSTTLMRHRLGFTDVLWALDEAEGGRVEFPDIEVGKIMVRVQGAMVLN